MPLIKRFFPGAKFIHVIRDGRDVALSDNGFFQITHPAVMQFSLLQKIRKLLLLARSRHQRHARRYNYRAFCRNVTFHSSDIANWSGIDLSDPRDLGKHRFLLQMQSWLNCVETAQRYGATMPDSYLEVKYEDLCHNPAGEAEKVFDFMKLPLGDETRGFLEKRIVTGRIAKWKTQRLTPSEQQDFDAAVRHGSNLLQSLGYTDAAEVTGR